MQCCRSLRALAILGLLVAACVEEPADVAEPTDQEPVPDDTVFQEVTVTLRPNGIEVSQPRPITAGEQRAQNEIKAAVARGESAPLGIAAGACSSTSFWYYERADWTGNRICFAGAGGTFLPNYVRRIIATNLVLNWGIRSGSFWAGSQSGRLVGYPLASQPGSDA